MADQEPSTERQSIPFGAMERPSSSDGRERSAAVESGKDGAGRERPRRRRRSRRTKVGGGEAAPSKPGEGRGGGQGSGGGGAAGGRNGGRDGAANGSKPRQGRRRRGARGGADAGQRRQPSPDAATSEAEGLLLIEHASHGHLRDRERSWLPDRGDVHVSPRLTQRYGLRSGSIVKGPCGRGNGRHKRELLDVTTVDGKPPMEVSALPEFKTLVTIDPDFHYAVGDMTGDLSLRILDLLCPVGRGQRGLIVAPPRSGKTILMQKFALAIEEHYEDVHPIVLLVDERPEEATEWTRTMKRGDVFVSTNDEPAKNHVELCEAVWMRCRRLVEMGEDVVLVLDSITRMARAYNHVHGNSGKTMSGGIDSRAMERPKQFFGSARNTEAAGSLTILGTTLVETGSRMDQVIFEEFKGTGNMELVLSRKLADRRVFPAIDIERSGTRKEEKLMRSDRLRLVHTLRRVLTRMHFAEAMELLLTRLDESATNDDFLKRFEIDPDE